MSLALVLWSFLWLAGSIGLFSYNAYGQDSQTEDALKEIRETANDICQTAPLEHTEQGLKLNGQAKAKVNGLIGKVANLGVEGSGQYNSEHSTGVIEGHIVDAIQAGNNCKLQVFNALEQDLIRNRPSSTPASPQQLQQHEWPLLKAEGTLRAALIAAEGPHRISVECYDDDCEALAEQISKTAKAAGWSSHVDTGTIAGIGSGLWVYGPSHLRGTTDRLGEALKDASGFPVQTGNSGNEFFIVVGRKPRS